MSALVDPAPPAGSAPPTGAHPVDPVARAFEVCPLLRSVDGAWSSIVPSRDLRCWAVVPAGLPSVTKQRQLCLVARHADCPTLEEMSAADRGIPGLDGRDALLWPVRSTVPVALEGVHPRGRSGVPAPRAGVQALLVAVMVLAFIVIVVTRNTPPSSPLAAGAAASPTPAATAIALASPTSSALAATASPTLSPAPSSAPPSASPAPSASPQPSASHRTYRVRSGDTLAVIAAKFHTTVKAIVTANNITDPRTIHPGQLLVIP